MSRKKLKDYYDSTFLKQLAEDFKQLDNTFNKNEFLKCFKGKKWEKQTLRERMITIVKGYHNFSSLNYERSIDVLNKLPIRMDGFYYIFLNDYVSLYGCSHEMWDISMKAMESFTQKNSAEFAIRSFLSYDFKKTMKQMKKWSKSKNEHLRRLSSEGIRTRLPWGKQVDDLFVHTDEIISILNVLKSDESLYVRRSVANNINDLAKDSPEVVVNIIKSWGMNDSKVEWILQHGTRTLRKHGHSEVMELMGYASEGKPIKVVEPSLKVLENSATINQDTSSFNYKVELKSDEEIKVKLGLAIMFVKANNKVSKKIFHLKDKKIIGDTLLKGEKKYPWIDLSTRKHYPGDHQVTLLVNGQEVASTTVTVKSSK